jgi:hypothetical protein
MKDRSDYDVFISYSHLDNEPLFKDQEGWISSFHKAMEVRLGQLLGLKPSIWHDKVLQGNDKFNDEIVGKLSNTKIFLAVISPCYLQSQWCMRELREFIKAAGTGGGLHIGSKSRIFKVVKTFIPIAQHPDEIRELLGYEFFLRDEKGQCREFKPDSKSRFHQEFFDKLDEVASDICDLIKEIEGENPAQSEISIEALDRELIARGAQLYYEELFKFENSEGTPARDVIMARVKELYDTASPTSSNEALGIIDTWTLAKILMHKTRKAKENRRRGLWYNDYRMDYYSVPEIKAKKNADCVAAIMYKDNLINEKDGTSALKVKNYGEVFNLCEEEPFRDEPILAGRVCSGFLVKEDIIATAGHFVNDRNVRDLRIVFGYRKESSSTSYEWLKQIRSNNIYKGVEIIGRVLNRTGDRSDWALVQLDREVEGREVAVLSKDEVAYLQPVYVIGHPVGLPLKYAAGACVRGIARAYFVADLDVYMGNSGSPVFSSETHEVIGMVVRDDTRDFRWTPKGWVSIVYPNRHILSSGPQCTKVSKFYINKDYDDIGYVDKVAYSQKIPSIFISHSHRDKEFVNPLVIELENAGMNVWIYEKEIEVGDLISKRIEEGISKCDFFCLVISRNSVKSKWVEREYRTALNAQMSSGTTPKIIPLLNQDVEELPPLLKDIKYADFSRDYNNGLTQLLNAIKKH